MLAILAACFWLLAACGPNGNGGDAGFPFQDTGDTGGDVEVDDTNDLDAPDIELPDLGDPDGADTNTDTGPDAIGDVTRADTTDTRNDVNRDTAQPLDPLRIDDIDPSSGPISGGTSMIIFGAGFTTTTDVLINGALADNIDLVDEFTILCNSPPNVSGTYSVKVANEDDQATLANAFTYFAPLSLELIEPDRGPTDGGTPVRIEGAGFTNDTVVSFGGRLGIDTVVVSDTLIDTLVPPHSDGIYDVRVTNRTGGASLPAAFTYYTPITIDRVEPAAGSVAGGNVATIRGGGFVDGATVRFGTNSADVVSITNATIVVDVPPGPVGAANVTVNSPANGGATLIDGYEYANGTDFNPIRVTPRTGDLLGGDRVAIVGTGLQDVDTVTFGGAAAVVVDATAYQVVVETPVGTGLVDVEVSDASNTATLADAFTFVERLRISDVTPSAGPTDGGDIVTITGTGFTAATDVRFGALPAVDLTFNSSTTLTVTVPPGPAGPVDVRLTDGAQSASLADGYTYEQALEVYSFSPSRGGIAGNTFVTIRGAGFIGNVSVTFDGNEAPVVTVVDPSTLEVRTPPGDAGRADVVVTVDAESQQADDPFLYFDPLTQDGGWWGDGIEGSVNVAVIEARSGQPVEGAYVTLSVRATEREFSGVTDANGRVSISGPNLQGEQTIHVSGPKHESNTVNSFNAENVTVFINRIICGCLDEHQCRSDEMCVTNPVDGMSDVCHTPVECESVADCELPGMVCARYPNGEEEPDQLCTEKCWCGCTWDGECFAGEVCDMQAGLCTPESQPSCTDNAECEVFGNYACQANRCLENCNGAPPPEIPVGMIYGTLTGVNKIEDPAPGEVLLGMVVTTTPDAFSGNPDPGNLNIVVGGDGDYELVSRLGDVVVIGLCGVYNQTTETFRPRSMDVRRFLNVRQDETYEVNLDCNIPLDQTLSFKLLNPPRGPAGPDINRVTPYLDFGPEGMWGGLVVAEGQGDVLQAVGLPVLEGELADVNYFIYGGSFTTTGNLPFSVAMMREVTNVDSLITLPPLLPPAELTQPVPFGTITGRRVEWELDTTTEPDFYYAYLYDPNSPAQTIYWQVWLPGDETGFNLPYFPDDVRYGPLPSGATMALIILSINAFSFDYDNFSYNDFGIWNWESYSASGNLVQTE